MDASLRREGDLWAIQWGGTVARVKDSKGLRHLAVLLGRPGAEVHCLELAGAPGARAAVSTDAAPLLDDRAKAEYRQRLGDLAADLDEAESFNDGERAARIQAEIDALVDQLTQAAGLSGRTRGAVTDAERARVAVRRAMKSALDRVADALPALGAHLDATVRTGFFCSYVPDPASPVRWLIGDAATSPPASAVRAERPVVVGRADEQATLLEAWQRGGVVLLAGEPGIGKTTLLRDLAARVDVAVGGRCDDHLGVPYQPLVELVRELVTVDGADVVAHDAGIGAPVLARIVPDLGVATAVSADDDRLLLFDTVARVIAAAAERHRLLVTVDDLHWAPPPTLSLLLHLLQTVAGAPVLVALTYRDTEIGADLRTFLAGAARLDAVTRIALGGIDADAIAELGAAADRAEQLAEHTGGNPFFVRALLESSLDGDLPANVLDVVAGRMQQLSDDARRLLTLAAVAGDHVPLAVAAGLGGVDAVDELLAAGFLVEDGAGVAFPHALARRAVVETVSGARRAALHLEVARTMEACGAGSAELAHHYAEAGALGHHEPVVRYGLAAADAALRALAFEEAVAHAERALPFAPDSSREHAELLLRVGAARHAAGDLAGARVALADAERIAIAVDDPALAADAVLEQGHYGAQFGAHEPEIADGLRRAIDRIGDDDARRSRLLARLAIEESGGGRHDDARALAAEALDIARTVGDDALLMTALTARHAVLDAPEHLDERLAIGRELEVVARRTGDLTFLVRATGILVTDAVERGDVDELDRALAELHRLVALRRVPHEQWFDLEQRVVRAVIDGDLDRAEALAEEELAAGQRAAVANAFRGYGTQLLAIRAEQGRAAEVVDIVVGLAERTGWATAETGMAAYACLAADRFDEAAALFAHLDVTALPRDSILLGVLCAGAELAMRVEDLPLASRVYELLLPFSGRTCTIALGTISTGPIDRYLSYAARTIGEHDRAREHLLDAIALDERMGAARWLERDRDDLERETTWESSPRRSSTG